MACRWSRLQLYAPTYAKFGHQMLSVPAERKQGRWYGKL